MPHLIYARLITLLVVILNFVPVYQASAQSMSHPDSKSPLKPNPYLKHQDPWRWDIRSQVFLRAGVVVIDHSQYREERTGSFSIEDFEYIYPIVREGGHYWSPNEDVEAKLRIDDAEFTPEPKVLQTPDSHTHMHGGNQTSVTIEPTNFTFYPTLSHCLRRHGFQRTTRKANPLARHMASRCRAVPDTYR
jgi:hypothetical protein